VQIGREVDEFDRAVRRHGQQMVMDRSSSALDF
jgi:hypothetical protein